MHHAALSPGAIRIVLAGIPGLTAGVVRECVVGQSDITIVGEFRQPEDLAELAMEHAIDVVVTACASDGVSAPFQALLFGPAGVPVIAIGTDGRLEVYDRRVLREAVLDELLAEIRKVATSRVEAPHS
jgi:hypothetical protein